jgi:hypothetical protein
MVTAGCPVTLNGHVFGTISSARATISSLEASGPGSGVAFIGVAGITSTSYAPSAWS